MITYGFVIGGGLFVAYVLILLFVDWEEKKP